MIIHFLWIKHFNTVQDNDQQVFMHVLVLYGTYSVPKIKFRDTASLLRVGEATLVVILSGSHY